MLGISYPNHKEIKMKEYSADYFIKKFKAIPSTKWIIGDFHNDSKTKFCVLGHCGMTNRYHQEDYTEEARELVELFKKYLYEDPADINNSSIYRYQQKTCKGRIMAALRKIKKLEIKWNKL